jgi:CubicO group peptidase (beta-lactamase class C family)
MHQIENQTPERDLMAYAVRKNCLKVSLILSFLLFFQFSHGQDLAAADQFLQKNMKALGNELVVVVQKNGKPIYTKELGKDFTLKTTAPAGDISQWFATVVVLQLHDEGKLQLDDPAAKYIPRFEQYMKGYITIRHSLSHTTGLDGGKEGVGKILTRTNFDNLANEVDTYITKRDIVANPGESFAYNRIGPAIAARTAEVATKKVFDRLAVEKLFRPLGMRQTMYFNDNGKVDPLKGAFTTGQDCVNFMQMLLEKGSLNGKTILKESTVAELLKPQFADARIDSKPEGCKDYDYTLTTWVVAKDGAGNATRLRQGSNGTQALIDFSSNTVVLVLLKDADGDKKKALVDELMNILSPQ